MVTDPKLVNDAFLNFYSDLYTSEYSPEIWKSHNPLEMFSYPKVDSSLSDKLGAPITAAEVQEAIGQLQNGKSPGPDGFVVEFYKAHSILISPHLVNVYNESFYSGRLPPTLSDANISLLLKKDKDPLECSNYRPISLLNVDQKILAKVLASRVQQALPALISTDQTGFMAGRNSSSNTRRLLNIIGSPNPVLPEVVISLDAEKAFDRVEWEYLYYVLSKFGFSSDFIAWIRLLYESPTAHILTNGVRSPPFALRRGTRQGCPLSPLLFALAIEPLAIWLREEGRVEGITRNDVTHKLSLYADDLLLYVSNPASSIPVITDILTQFGKYSGYKLNFNKSELLPINSLSKKMPQSSFPFRVVTEGFRYLGIFITASFNDLVNKNFRPLIDKCKLDLARWSSLSPYLAELIW